MCGRFTLTDPERLRAEFGRRFDFSRVSHNMVPRFNVAPTQEVLAVRNDGRSSVELLRWGIEGRINARDDTITRHPQSHRCVIFADGFFEWRERRPTHFSINDRKPFAFAGIFAPFGDRPAVAIVTCSPNAVVQPVHDRMPVMLDEDGLSAWLAPESLSTVTMRELLRPYPASSMCSIPASSRLNKARYDASDVLRDDDPTQTTLFG